MGETEPSTPPTELRCEVARNGTMAWVQPFGELDLDSVHRVEAALEGLRDEPAVPVAGTSEESTAATSGQGDEEPTAPPASPASPTPPAAEDDGQRTQVIQHPYAVPGSEDPTEPWSRQ